jgi:hypothetical protein
VTALVTTYGIRIPADKDSQYKRLRVLLERTGTKRFTVFGYDELFARDQANLDITWLRDPDAEDGGTLPPPEVIAQEIVETCRPRSMNSRQLLRRWKPPRPPAKRERRDRQGSWRPIHFASPSNHRNSPRADRP